MSAFPQVHDGIIYDLDHGDGLTAYDLGRADLHVLEPLDRVPDNVTVMVNVGTRTLLSVAGVWELHTAERRLTIRFNSPNPDIVRHWRRAIRTGEIA